MIQWDGRDAKAQALIALSVKKSLIPHIRSCVTARESWDKLASLYQVRNEAHVAYLHKHLKDQHMNEGDSMDAYLIAIKDLKEQLANIDEDIHDSQLVSSTMDGLHDSYQCFVTILRLVAMGNANYYSFDQLVTLLL